MLIVNYVRLKVPEAILIQTLEKGTEGLVMRRKEEWHLWQNSTSNNNAHVSFS